LLPKEKEELPNAHNQFLETMEMMKEHPRKKLERKKRKVEGLSKNLSQARLLSEDHLES